MTFRKNSVQRSAYITLRGTQAQLAVVRSNVETRSETTDITRWQQEAGVGDMLQPQQAVSTLKAARAAIMRDGLIDSDQLKA